jgi:carboxylate-amine ligase
MVPAREMIEKLLAFARPALEEGGDWEEVSFLACETLERGNGAARQRETYGRAGRRHSRHADRGDGARDG